MSAKLKNQKKSKDTIPQDVVGDIGDVPELDQEEKKKDKEFIPFASTDRTKVQKKKMSPKDMKKKSKGIEKAIMRKEKTETSIEKKLKKTLVKKRWNSLY
ncbi:hypothetical protein SAMD00019534_025680 [Acytostelium subglobosum LB1]|uniref:hypothetical protein n=1 Tax=Acytostelium subglobosum LB1 TaxID=1410327 RepID=UPI0006449B11|nr:hypothetical protein SAMD00019534_025680 [Acytostelium subglobosum LB1]GAM19393.1 hypothetical protein SAMD00019534_025680 [Acytostelium subglobosum LB1]|eukprot:XP_012757320.1 hypothetical protein SAMD00019534_025680 [Acytostelium subglobosum LB1]